MPHVTLVIRCCCRGFRVLYRRFFRGEASDTRHLPIAISGRCFFCRLPFRRGYNRLLSVGRNSALGMRDFVCLYT